MCVVEIFYLIVEGLFVGEVVWRRRFEGRVRIR